MSTEDEDDEFDVHHYDEKHEISNTIKEALLGAARHHIRVFAHSAGSKVANFSGFDPHYGFVSEGWVVQSYKPGYPDLFLRLGEEFRTALQLPKHQCLIVHACIDPNLSPPDPIVPAIHENIQAYGIDKVVLGVILPWTDLGWFPDAFYGLELEDLRLRRDDLTGAVNNILMLEAAGRVAY